MYCTCGNFNGLFILWTRSSRKTAPGESRFNISLLVYRQPTGFSLRVVGVELFHELYDLILDFVDQLLALDLSGLACDQSQACLLVFCVEVACDCPQTVRQLRVQRIVVLFAAGSWLS